MGLLGLAVVGAALLGSPLAFASSTLRWSGGAAEGSRGWTNATNWEDGAIPSSSEPVTLEFPRLTSASCTSSPPTDTCYESENNVSGLNVESLRVEDSQTYVIAGEPITLGSGGLTAAPATNTTEQIGSIVAMPIVLGAPQTWSIAGQSGDAAIDGNQFVLLEEVSGAGHTLNVKLSDGGGLVLVNEDEVGPLSLEGAEPSRAGVLNGVVELYGAQLNAADREPVSFNHVLVVGTGATGPLTTNAAEIFVEPGGNKVERLEVQGAALDPKSTLAFAVTEASGTTAGRSYSQLASQGSVDLDGAELVVAADDSCKPLWSGATYTLVTSTGGITGSFGNAAEGEKIPIEFPKGCTIAQTLQIHYERNGSTQTVTGTVIPGATSTTTLGAAPADPVTNQSVTLTATVRTSAETPSGQVEFRDGDQPISGCASIPLVATDSGYSASCQTIFVASEFPQQLSAEFQSDPDDNVESSSATDDLTVGRGPTATSLQVTPSTTPVNQNVSYTATVSTSAGGLIQLGGTVMFADGGVPIGSCSAQPLQRGIATSLTATCLLSYPSQGTHSITASYSGDSNFAGSSSAAQTLTVEPWPEAQFSAETKPGEAKLGSTSILVSNRADASVTLTCSGATGCNGTLTLLVREAVKGKHGKKTFRSVKIGSEAFSIAAGKTAAIDVHLNATGRALLASHKDQIGASLQLAQSSGSTQTNVRLAEAKSRGKKKG